MTEIGFSKFPSLFGRLTGQNGAVREYLALVDAGNEYCILPKVDAYALGYPEVARTGTSARALNATTFVTHTGYDKAPLIKMVQVDVGRHSIRDVEFLAYDLPQVCGFDVVLGRSLLRFLSLEIDYTSGLLRIERELIL